MPNHRLFLKIVGRAATLVLLANMAAALPQPSTEPRQSVVSRSQPERNRNPQLTAVTGPSWLQHLGRPFDETSMGKTGRLGPLEITADEELVRELAESVRGSGGEAVMLHGSDLYRMNCRGCHGENGTGAPPEINSVINPVRATSARAVMERMRNSGMPISRADAARLAAQSRTMLLDRLHHGGENMPAFPHLSPAEVTSLVAYLRQLAGVPEAENEQLRVPEPRVRIGEHIAKSTCHVCHNAAGQNPTAQQLYMGAIPPLSALVLRTNRAEFVRKVTQGAPILMGEPRQLLRGRMPVFYYLSPEEAADVYSYLTQYPPHQDGAFAGAAGSEPGTGAPEPEYAQPIAVGASAETMRPETSQSQAGLAEEQITILAVLLGVLASMVLCLGFWFSVCELRRLGGESEGAAARADSTVERPSALNPELAA